MNYRSELAISTALPRVLQMRHLHYILLLALSANLAAIRADASDVEVYDVVIYGGTSAAVTAAVEASRADKTVIIVSPDHHLGGMTSNGLGWTDVGVKSAIGGLSREFYQRIYNHYQNPRSWVTETRQSYVKRSYMDPDERLKMMFTFEPKVARQVLEAMLEEADVEVFSGKLNRSSGVTVRGQRIESLETTTGQKIAGKVFLDATYEGDLLAAAGVSFTVGREQNSQYQETLNGIQTTHATKNQLPEGIDPYVIPGDPSSGLLPGINADAGGADGAQDQRLQAYNYRMVLTNLEANRVTVPKPGQYNESDYELLFRAIEAGQKNGFFKLDPMPNHKTDSNNSGGISTDFIGGNYDLATGHNYVEADDAARQQILDAHINYQLGLLWTLQNHPRVPAVIRAKWRKWGLPADEFPDNNHWPNQIYVREARRMIGSLVITERHVNQVNGFEIADSIGMGGYNMDSHNVQRHVGPGGTVRNEGDIQVKPARGPYPISYRAIIPQRGEAENLLVPVAVSSTHIAYGSIRMEPVFMVLGQSAGAAAVLIIDLDCASQDLPYDLLRSRLLQYDQVLASTRTTRKATNQTSVGAAK